MSRGSQHALALPWDAFDKRHRALNAIEQEGMRIGTVPEDQEDARFERDRRNAEHLFEVPSHLFLLVVLLKGAARRQQPVSIGLGFAGIGGGTDEDGDAQALLRELESPPQSLGTLARTLDDVEHVSEMDHLGVAPRFVRPVRRIPAVSGVAKRLQEPDVVAEAATVVEERVLRREDAVADEELHRPRQIRARYRGSVTPYFHVLLSLAHQVVASDHQATPFELP